MSDPENPPPSAHEQGYWPDSKAIYRNFEDLQAHLNGRVNLRLGDPEAVEPALQAEQKLRFETDDVPEVISPPFDWNHSFLLHKWKFSGQPIPSTEEVLESLASYLDPPLVKDELLILYDHCMKLCNVVNGRLQEELNVEKTRIEHFLQSNQCILETYNFFRDSEFGDERLNIMARHFVKRRWQRLGLWGESWGIPGRYYQWSKERDDFSHWSEEWRADLRDLDKDAAVSCVSDLVMGRESFLRGQYHVIAARERLRTDASPAEVWDFITSRPWFLWEAEKAEEYIRFNRVSRPIREMFNSHTAEPDDLKSLHNRIDKMWMDRSIWAPEWSLPPADETTMAGWWWPHEEGSSEEEDLTVLNNIEQVLRYATESSLEYTESECEALNQMAPDELKPHRRRGKRVHFDGDEEKKWAESKEVSHSTIDKYAEEARQHANPDSSAHIDGDAEVEDLPQEATRPRKAIIFPWISDSEIYSSHMGAVDDEGSECEIDYIEEPEESSDPEINFFDGSDEGSRETMDEPMSEGQDVKSTQHDGLGRSDTFDCEEEPIVYDDDVEEGEQSDVPEAHSLEQVSSTAGCANQGLQKASDSFDSLWDEEQLVPDKSETDNPGENLDDDLDMMPPPAKPAPQSTGNEVATSLGLTYGYEQVKEMPQQSDSGSALPIGKATEEAMQRLSISVGKEPEFELEKTPDGLVFPRQLSAGPDESLFTITDPFYLKEFQSASGKSDEPDGERISRDHGDDLISPKTKSGAESQFTAMPTGSVKDDQNQVTTSHTVSVQHGGVSDEVSPKTLSVDLQSTTDVVEKPSSQQDHVSDSKALEEEEPLWDNLYEPVSPETEPETKKEATAALYRPMNDYEHQCPRDCSDGAHSDNAIDDSTPPSPSSDHRLDIDVDEDPSLHKDPATESGHTDSELPKENLSTSTQLTHNALSNDLTTVDVPQVHLEGEEVANDACRRQPKTPEWKAPSLPSQEGPLSESKAHGFLSPEPEVSQIVSADRMTSHPSELSSERLPSRGTKRTHTMAFSSSSEGEDEARLSPSQTSKDRIGHRVKRRMMSGHQSPSAFVEDRIPGLVELSALRRRAESSRGSSPLRQSISSRVPLPDAPTEISGYEGDDEELPEPRRSPSRSKSPVASVYEETVEKADSSKNVANDEDEAMADAQIEGQNHERPVVLGPFRAEGVKKLPSPRISTEKLTRALERSEVLDTLSSVPSVAAHTSALESAPDVCQDESLPTTTLAEQPPEMAVDQPETQTQEHGIAIEAQKASVLGPLWHGVKKPKPKKYPHQSFSGPTEQRDLSAKAFESSPPMNTLGGSVTKDPQPPAVENPPQEAGIRNSIETENEIEPSGLPDQMVNVVERPAVLKPISKAGVKKRTKVEYTGALRRSIRAAALRATAKLALMEW